MISKPQVHSDFSFPTFHSISITLSMQNVMIVVMSRWWCRWYIRSCMLFVLMSALFTFSNKLWFLVQLSRLFSLEFNIIELFLWYAFPFILNLIELLFSVLLTSAKVLVLWNRGIASIAYVWTWLITTYPRAINRRNVNLLLSLLITENAKYR